MFSGLTGWHLIVLALSIVPFVLWLIAVIQIASAKAPSGPTVLWLLLVTLVTLIGPILWFAIGRGSIQRNAPPTLQ
ncbi:PLDc N-terminal domain-containing protein [Leifsonia sp. LS-T14]|uniref:PLDc N-terminal domain-containing protein n=1 Tax=unclassified Leifsonia TaxID=2663824 RepID=UPI0035A6CE2B